MPTVLPFSAAQKLTRPKAFTTLVKPVGSACNLRCDYCYYLGKAELYGGKEPVMSEELLEEYIRQYIEAVEVPIVTFCWHGGEPLLAGLNFYRRAVMLQEKYRGAKQIENTLQTNGLLINGEWCAFFREHHFLVGLSLDGPEDIHDAYRRDRGGHPTWTRVMQAAQMMAATGVDFNILCTVNARSAGRGAEVYRFLRNMTPFIQFLPVSEYADAQGRIIPPQMLAQNQVKTSELGYKETLSSAEIKEKGDKVPFISAEIKEQGDKATLASAETNQQDIPATAAMTPWSITGAEFGQFMCDVYDEWVRSDVGRVYVQLFDNTLAQWCGQPASLCALGESCGEGLAVEHNGDVYVCDHFVYPAYRLGNLRETPLAELFQRPERFRFGAAKYAALPKLCQRCRWVFLCHGECPKHRFVGGVSSLCKGYKMFYAHTAADMQAMRNLLERNLPPALIMRSKKS